MLKQWLYLSAIQIIPMARASAISRLAPYCRTAPNGEWGAAYAITISLGSARAAFDLFLFVS